MGSEKFKIISPLVGREEPLAQIIQRFESARQGTLEVVSLWGEPGVGKTRLLTEVERETAKNGATVLKGGAWEAEGMPPYLPFLEALGGYIRQTSPQVLTRQLGSYAPILAGILPELNLHLPQMPAGYNLPPEQARLRLYEAVGHVLKQISLANPLVLLLDDLQWADSASLDLLCYLARSYPHLNLLIVGAYRQAEVSNNPALERTLLELTRLRVLTSFGLEPLSQTELTTLATSRFNRPVDPALAQLLYEQSEGNPFFAEELLSDWHEHKALLTTPEYLTLAFDRINDVTSPASIQSLIRQRFNRLPQTVVEDLRVAALIGRTFEIKLLAQAVGQKAEALETRLLPAVKAGLLNFNAQNNRYQFSHDKIRECLYNELTPTRKLRLHGFIGRALEEAEQTSQTTKFVSSTTLAELAYHFSRSGDRERGLNYSWQAAEAALKAYAFDEALLHYRIALKQLAAIANSANFRQADLLLALGEAALLAGKEAEAVQTFESARNWFEQNGEMAAMADVLYRQGRAYWRQEKLAEAQQTFEQALTLLETEPNTALKGRILVDLGSLCAVSLHQYQTGIGYARQALVLAQQSIQPALEIAALRTVGNLLVRSNHLEEGMPLLKQALEKALLGSELTEAAECCACLAQAHLWNGELTRFKAVTRRWEEVARRTHDPYQLRHVYLWQALGPFLGGNIEQGRQILAQAHEQIKYLSSPEPKTFFAFITGMLALHEGNYLQAESLMLEAVATFRQIGVQEGLIWWLGPLGLAQIQAGKKLEAFNCLVELETLLELQPTLTMARGEALCRMAQIALLLEDKARLENYYLALQSFAGRFMDVLVDRILGETQLFLGNFAQAKIYLDRAEVVARQEGLRPELAYLLSDRGSLARIQGQPEQAQTCYTQALELFKRSAMQGDFNRLTRQLETSPKPAAPLPAGLSAREAAVLTLVAAGKSNREIALALSLSEKTVANHLTAIFNKLGVDNRAAAAALAIKHNLS